MRKYNQNREFLQFQDTHRASSKISKPEPQDGTGGGVCAGAVASEGKGSGVGGPGPGPQGKPRVTLPFSWPWQDCPLVFCFITTSSWKLVENCLRCCWNNACKPLILWHFWCTSIHACLYIGMHVCMYVCMQVCMSVAWMYVSVPCLSPTPSNPLQHHALTL